MDLVEAVAEALRPLLWMIRVEEPDQINKLARAAIQEVKRWEMQQLEVGRDAYREKYKATMPGGK
jgi:hypothetical protein